MKQTFGDFMKGMLFNMLIGIWGLIPAIVLLILHFTNGISWLFALLAAVLWLLIVIMRSYILYFAASNSRGPYEQRPNKNPYSAKTSDVLKEHDEQ